jgi:hypothetical protein
MECVTVPDNGNCTSNYNSWDSKNNGCFEAERGWEMNRCMCWSGLECRNCTEWINRKDRKLITLGVFTCEITAPSAVHTVNSQQMQRTGHVKYRLKELRMQILRHENVAIDWGSTTGIEGDSCGRAASTLCWHSLQFNSDSLQKHRIAFIENLTHF